jgi:hypothetical protein
MGFFSLLETFFFLSLAITFVLIIMLVYHFKGRLVVLEDKYHTMFDIINSLVKEMKNLRDSVSQQYRPIPEQIPISFGGPSGMFPPELFRAFQNPSNTYIVEEETDDYEEEEEEEEPEKIIVSDTELESDDEDDYHDDQNVKIISVININQNEENISLDDLEEDENILNQLDIDSDDDSSQLNETNQKSETIIYTETPGEVFVVNKLESLEPVDYKKLDVSYLRTMVLTRGLATDTKKMKKPDLIRLLEEAHE